LDKATGKEVWLLSFSRVLVSRVVWKLLLMVGEAEAEAEEGRDKAHEPQQCFCSSLAAESKLSANPQPQRKNTSFFSNLLGPDCSGSKLLLSSYSFGNTSF
jgi:hypothetical protein